MADEPEGVQVPVVWVGPEELPVLYVNSFVAQVDKEEVFLLAGQLVPPAVVGTEEQRREQANNISFAPIRPVARLAMNPARLRELISILEITLTNYEHQKGQFGDPRDA